MTSELAIYVFSTPSGASNLSLREDLDKTNHLGCQRYDTVRDVLFWLHLNYQVTVAGLGTFESCEGKKGQLISEVVNTGLFTLRRTERVIC